MTQAAAVPRPVVLARHGETDDNAAGRFQGVRNPPLNARGREQAAALADRLAAGGDLAASGAARLGHEGVSGAVPPIVAIWASPYARARETAEIIAARLRLPVVFDLRLKESDVGEWSGRTYAEVQASDPAGFQGWVEGDPAHVFPGGESLAEVSARVQDVVADARALAPTVLCVCHGGVIRSALRAAGLPLHEPGVARQPSAGVPIPTSYRPVANLAALNGEAVAL